MARSDEREKIEAERREIAKRFLAATRAWIKHVDAGEQEDAVRQTELRRREMEALRANYWTLDPYVRSRTILDRTGVIRPGGIIEFYPDRKENVASVVAATEEKTVMIVSSGDAAIAAHQGNVVAS
ncbi:hypothetical protein ONZ43_g7613 [Nemania bipapillata]|uniref:Uncharacterized protein n=1 Tax=Nemania bipapillata TaxID=110536 RepID=A0ACC2HPG6_9PEZI|nr:hypothetical protein ONZ43_g7613 [Nemania bipapillata]